MTERDSGLDLHGRTAIVTGGGSGIGRALAEALAAHGARVVVADVDRASAGVVAERIGGVAATCDVGDPDAVHALVAEHGPIDVFCSNAGITDRGDSVEDVRRIVDVNLLAHVWAAQAVLPGMIERGRGWLVQTISSAALITGPSGMGYTLTKHGALGFAEWVALHHAHLGITVTCLCPNVVRTNMIPDDPETLARLGDIVEPETVAAMALDAMASGQFLVLPHPRVGESFLRKATNYDEWIAGTNRRLRRMRGDGD